MKHINIPIFIPHLGCPNQCIFCNQRSISGNESFCEENVEKEILEVLKTTNKDDACEIAFFGGSFTGIERSLMIRLLCLAQKYVELGKVKGIRMSTRPDYISSEIIEILKKHTISCVELGIQTINDKVLKYLKRGHTFEDTEKAIDLLNGADLPFVGQMMIGLPGATADDEIDCATYIASKGACGSRIYPTLVLRKTELENMTINGEYTPLSLDEAIERSARVLKIFNDNNVPCIRIGLCDSDNLHSEESFVAGPNSPSIGEMVKSRVYYDVICKELDENSFEKAIIIYCPKGRSSQVIGNNKKNIINLKIKYGLDNIKVIEDDNLTQFNIKIRQQEEAKCV